jgi:transcriptional regulator with XRE-family HTH domain
MGILFDSTVQNDFFARKLRELRLQKTPYLSQERAARRLGITRATLANYELGRVAAPLWFACAAASYYGVGIEELVEMNDERMREACERRIRNSASGL